MAKLFVYAVAVFLIIFGPLIAAADPKIGVPFWMGALIFWGGPAGIAIVWYSWRRAVWKKRGQWIEEGRHRAP